MNYELSWRFPFELAATVKPCSQLEAYILPALTPTKKHQMKQK